MQTTGNLPESFFYYMPNLNKSIWPIGAGEARHPACLAKKKKKIVYWCGNPHVVLCVCVCVSCLACLLWAGGNLIEALSILFCNVGPVCRLPLRFFLCSKSS